MTSDRPSTHRASCRCGQLRATCEGDPVRVSVCHCRACQQRSGSAFGAAVRFPARRVTIEGKSKLWTRHADSGHAIDYHFCPQCGATVHYSGGNFPDAIAIPLGLFDDPYAFSPAHSVWEQRKHEWVDITGDDVEHSD